MLRSELVPALGDESLEAVRVEPLGIERQLVAMLAGDDYAGRAVAGPERLSQPRDVYLQRPGGGLGWMLAPELVDQPLGGERLVDVHEKQRQQRPSLASRRRYVAALIEGPQWAEDGEVHSGYRTGGPHATYRSFAHRPNGCRRPVTGL